MNNCPLTYLNKENVNELLTPNHLIYERSLTSVNKNGMVEINEIKIKTIKVFTTNLLKQLMGKFKHEYLLALQQRHSYDRNVKSSDYLKIADVVIVKDQTLPQLSWRKERVMELLTGNDDVFCESLPKER